MCNHVMTEIRRGQRLDLEALYPAIATHCFQVDIAIPGFPDEVDIACFGLDSHQKLANERYMTFYNQPESPCGGVKLLKVDGQSAQFLCTLSVLPANIGRLVFTAALNSSATMRQMAVGGVGIHVEGREIVRYSFSGEDFHDEKALMLVEIYRKDDSWRVCAAGQGFSEGLAGLVGHFGGKVAEELPEQKNKISLEKKMAVEAPKLVDLAKKAMVCLDKHNLSATVAKVGLVLDASGSMFAQYDKGKVQQVIERLLPLAVHFDDDGELEVWAFSSKTLALPPATLQNYADYISSANNGWRNWGMMSINNEPAVIEQVIQHYSNTLLPVLIIFVSDGGVSQNAAIKKLLVEASKLPIFWQFVGIGGRNYGVLEKLDTLAGRVVDNCGFFSLDDLASISEQALYERLLDEFPVWLEAAKFKGIIR